MTAADWRAPFVFRDNRVVHVTGMCIQGSCCVLETLDAATQTFIEFRVSIVLFLVSVYTFLGTCCLSFFGGIGLSALPMDMINEFRFR